MGKATSTRSAAPKTHHPFRMSRAPVEKGEAVTAVGVASEGLEAFEEEERLVEEAAEGKGSEEVVEEEGVVEEEAEGKDSGMNTDI